ncbi:tRNA pseudouridine(38-40) synthase TruA [Hominifimenecus sp. rT4P-3]|uniref:tRNA pseudouridine(38-40) synthase TruA n=1 Tax=Hominifimenecus sp. rT4P-3 TaxID=3242979 RepID=UPI003DA2D3FE
MNYRLIIQYDGTRYVGWQRQAKTADTIQGKIEGVLSRMTGSPIEIHGAGRTDAGVHALGQVANVRLKTEKSPEEIRAYLNTYLPEDIGIVSVAEASERFHSRLNAIGKIYCYRLATDPALHVLERKYMAAWETPLDQKAMKKAAGYLIGTHDFQSFCARKSKKSTVRRLDEIHFEEFPGELRLTFHGNGFLYHMVRILTGTLLEIGSGQRRPEEIPSILEAKERRAAGFTAPAQGLTLVEVLYS